jgi:hypothetical protein
MWVDMYCIMGNRAKSEFCSVLFNQFHHRTKLMALLFGNLVFERLLGSQKSQTLSTKGNLYTNFDLEWDDENFVKRISS